jgi:hypothetical protein
MKATKRVKVAGKKSKGIKRGKSLESVKPLTRMSAPAASPKEEISLPFGKIEVQYNPQKS